LLKLPSVQASSGMLAEGSLFQRGSNLHFMNTDAQDHGDSGIFIEIVRILGTAHRYLAAGGPKADSHFPWHTESTLSKIRQELDLWITDHQYTYSSVENAFSSLDSYTIMLSKIVYHLVHCLIYRPFIPINVFELTTASQQQAWRIEATNVCFYHANAIAEHVQLWKANIAVDFPAFLGYCMATAATVHLHGAYYAEGGGVFAASKSHWDFQTRQLLELRKVYDGVQYQSDFLRSVRQRHATLVKNTVSPTVLRSSPVFSYEDFFDRYHGHVREGAFLLLENITSEPRR
jgi:hypothetical protein